jgi:hypothetical protein
MPELKYETEIRNDACNLEKYSERNGRIAYRWVFSDISDKRNFLPVYILTPWRKNKGYRCDGWALSLYETKKQAKDKLRFLAENDPNIHLKLGTHTAEGILNIDDGISDNASASVINIGHFNHFEYKDVELMPKFSIVECVISV